MYIRVQSSGTKILAETFDALGEEELSKDFRLKWLRRWPPGIKYRSATCCSSRFETGTFAFKVRSSTGRPRRLSDDDSEATITI